MSIDSFPLEQPQPDYMVVTSTTRPTNPYSGLHIYETDTQRLMYWQGTNWVQVVNFRMFAAGSSIAGAAPPAIDTGVIPFKMQGGTLVSATNASGDFTITFPTAFPNGVLLVLVQQGDNTHAGASFIPYAGGASVSAQVVRMYNSSGGVWANSGNFRVSWLAIGY